jgi:hypothetical protein
VFSVVGVPVDQEEGSSASVLWFLLHVDERRRFVYVYDFCPSVGLQHHVRAFITNVLSKTLQLDKPLRVIPTSPICIDNADDSGYMVFAAACFKAAGFDISPTEDSLA